MNSLFFQPTEARAKIPAATADWGQVDWLAGPVGFVAVHFCNQLWLLTGQDRTYFGFEETELSGVSAAARQKIAEAQRKRWAAQKKRTKKV
jgi:hypothetical protein